MKRGLITAVFGVSFVVLALSAWAPAQDGPKDTPDQAAARAAVMAFADLLADPDFAKAKAAFAGGEEDLKIAQNIHQLIHTKTKLIAAVKKAMPNEKVPPSDDLTVEGLKKRLPQQPVKIDNDTATVGPDWKLKKVDGAWKVTDLMASPGAKKAATTLFPAMSAVMNEALPEIEAGKYKTPQEMEAAMRPRLQAAMNELQKKMMPGAATRPAGQ